MRRVNQWLMGILSFWLALNVTAASSGVAPNNALNPENSDVGAVILMYHHVGHPSTPDIQISTELFAQHLRYLKAHQFNVWPLEKLLNALEKRLPIPDKTVVLTADDGYLSLYENAFPLLKQFGFPMTFFISTQVIDQRVPVMMRWEQMREMAQSGMTFANHTQTHPYLWRQPNESERDWKERVSAEVLQAQQRLKAELGAAVLPVVAYPYGEVTPDLEAQIKAMGFWGMAQNSGAVGGQSDPQALLRFPMNDRYGAMEQFKIKVEALPLAVESVEPQETLIPQNPPSLTLNFAKPNPQGVRCYDAQGHSLVMQWRAKNRLTVTSPSPMEQRRSHYTCTQPVDAKAKRWRWWSHLWINPCRDEQGEPLCSSLNN